jgi:multiple sugar transport system ATP-binding protein
MPRVLLRALNKSFGSARVFEDFGLEVADGELLCLLGPSGSGKTTLIRIIAGLETLDGGEVWIGDREISGLQPRDRHVGMMFQGYALYPHLTVRQNLAYPLKVRHVPREEIQRRVGEAARMLGITHLLGRYVDQVSGGEQQRVAIGRAIVQKPQLYLLDEPISNLDASLRESVRTELRRLQQELHATMIMVTHDQLDALAIADRIALLHAGRLQQIGTPRELYLGPANVFVAGFIGRTRMNLLPCRSHGDGSGILHGAQFELRLPPSVAGGLPSTSAEVVVGIRPEAIQIRAAPRGAPLEATVETIHFHGDQALCGVRLGAELVQVTLGSGIALAPGARVALCPRSEQIHLFDRTTGERLAAPSGAASETEPIRR